MPPEKDSQRQDNDGQGKKSGEVDQSKNRTAGYMRARSQKHSPATKLGERFNTIGSLGMIPILLAVGPIIGIFVGQWLDDKFETSPWLTVIFVILGFVAGSREMYLLLKRENAKEKQKNKTENTENKEQD